MDSPSSQNSFTANQSSMRDEGRHTDDLLRSLFAEMQEMRQAMNRMNKDCTCNGHQRRNRAIDFETSNAYDQTLFEDVSRRNKRDFQAWFNDTRGNRIYSTIKTGSFKQKAMHVAKRYIDEKTSWDLTGQALEDQANRMYQNTRYIAHGFCSRHFPGKKGTGFFLGKQAIDQILLYATMFDYIIWRISDRMNPNDRDNALLPLHLIENSWLSRAILCSIFRNANPRKKQCARRASINSDEALQEVAESVAPVAATPENAEDVSESISSLDDGSANGGWSLADFMSQ
ncbi:hypothetical protein EDC96DRAFT_578479 [Choanephora cucurbitarum]|nr:hypothetical protein EDC96DRAFT_578479 [Choanephora cucurbitarum]